MQIKFILIIFYYRIENHKINNINLIIKVVYSQIIKYVD